LIKRFVPVVLQHRATAGPVEAGFDRLVRVQTCAWSVRRDPLGKGNGAWLP